MQESNTQRQQDGSEMRVLFAEIKGIVNLIDSKVTGLIKDMDYLKSNAVTGESLKLILVPINDKLKELDTIQMSKVSLDTFNAKHDEVTSQITDLKIFRTSVLYVCGLIIIGVIAKIIYDSLGIKI